MPRGTEARWRRGRGRAGAASLCAVGLLLGAPGAARAESAWIKDELSLNLRTGPGVQFRIMGRVETGDAVQVLERGDGWTKVGVPSIGEGWIPEGYLQPTPPAAVRLAQSESQTTEFREQLESLTKRAAELEQENEKLAGRDGEQRQKITTLTRENLELRAGARWPEWITGAAILGSGMLMGMIVRSLSGRRSRPRIRL
jgi:SH3 domain protein